MYDGVGKLFGRRQLGKLMVEQDDLDSLAKANGRNEVLNAPNTTVMLAAFEENNLAVHHAFGDWGKTRDFG